MSVKSMRILACAQILDKWGGSSVIEIQGLTKAYPVKGGGTFTAIEGIDLTIQDGDIFGIIGMSGAGKSTLVRCINLLEQPTKGSIRIDGVEVTAARGKELLKLRRKIGMVFQKFNLLMQRTILDNVALPLEIAGVDKAARMSRAKELLELVGLGDQGSKYPAQLSGGQQQRVPLPGPWPTIRLSFSAMSRPRLWIPSPPTPF